MRNGKSAFSSSFPLTLFPRLPGVREHASGDGGLWLGANNPVNQLAVFENQHRGNALNLELSRGAGIVIDVQLGYPITSVRLGSKLFHDWADDAAGSAPWRPTIEQHRPGAVLDYFLLEARISHDDRLGDLCDLHSAACIQRRAALAALRELSGSMASVDAIFSSTIAASYNQHSFFSSSRFASKVISYVGFGHRTSDGKAETSARTLGQSSSKPTNNWQVSTWLEPATF
jgi:hypothetical protein